MTGSGEENHPIEVVPDEEFANTGPGEHAAGIESTVNGNSPVEPPDTPSVSSELAGLRQRLDELGQDFRSKIQYDAHKNQIIDKLHDELQEYRKDPIRKLLRPILLDTIMVADDIRKLVLAYRAKDPEQLDPQKLLNLMDGIAEDLDNLLYRQGVDSFRVEGESFDPKRQKILKRVLTGNPEKDKTVAERIRGGYQWEGRVIRPELVMVHVHQPTPQLNRQNGTIGGSP